MRWTSQPRESSPFAWRTPKTQDSELGRASLSSLSSKRIGSICLLCSVVQLHQGPSWQYDWKCCQASFWTEGMPLRYHCRISHSSTIRSHLDGILASSWFGSPSVSTQGSMQKVTLFSSAALIFFSISSWISICWILFCFGYADQSPGGLCFACNSLFKLATGA